MKTLLSTLVALGLLLFTGCDASSNRRIQLAAVQQELNTQRDEMQRLRAQVDAERQRLSRSIAILQSRVEDLDRIVNMASTEIWGNGSSTGARLSTAQRALADIRAEVVDLATALATAPRTK
jgi:hypothetical protein